MEVVSSRGDQGILDTTMDKRHQLCNPDLHLDTKRKKWKRPKCPNHVVVIVSPIRYETIILPRGARDPKMIKIEMQLPRVYGILQHEQ
mmetsp:Transcript_25715/g.40467  ORF Transcript_25715/g.40467 Transcript_25715/m.40467 type:complete len:88 (+) Transcript_25715:338-601(+)